MRNLTEWELAQLQGMMAMTPEEMAKAQGEAARAITKKEMAKKQLEAAKDMQNHFWPWQEEANPKGGDEAERGFLK